MEKMLEKLESLRLNWMNHTEHERITILREVIVDVSNLNFENKISSAETSEVLSRVNTLMVNL